MNRQDFDARVASAKPGEPIVYHTGAIMFDRVFGGTSVDDVAKAAFQAMEAGKVHLTQHRLGKHLFAYIAVKRPAPHKRITWTGCYDPDPMQHSTPLDKVAA
jgi:hypothetical protein